MLRPIRSLSSPLMALLASASVVGCMSTSGEAAVVSSDSGPGSTTHETGTSVGSDAGDAIVAHESGTDSGVASDTKGDSTPADTGSTGPVDAGSTGAIDSGPTGTIGAMVFSPYKDTSINMDWSHNVISTQVGGSATPLASDLQAAGGHTITLAFATGECGAENWGGVQGDAMASANVSLLSAAGIDYILSTGGAAGSFTCATDAGMSTFLARWASPHLIGVDFDIEAGQSQDVITALVQRIQKAHGTNPGLRFSLTIATLGGGPTGSTASSLGSGAPDDLNVYGDDVIGAVKSVLGFDGSSASWPSYVTVNLMVMDYGDALTSNCVVSGGACDMGQSAIQAAYNLHDKLGVPYANIELTPMIGGNDATTELFTLENADATSAFVKSQGLAGVHYWSYDRDTDCPKGAASPTCNTMGSGYAGARGFLARFLADGM
ncbi:MAG: glycosyl hydrolase [Polyangiales bacterium]